MALVIRSRSGHVSHVSPVTLSHVTSIIACDKSVTKGSVMENSRYVTKSWTEPEHKNILHFKIFISSSQLSYFLPSFIVFFFYFLQFKKLFTCSWWHGQAVMTVTRWPGSKECHQESREQQRHRYWLMSRTRPVLSKWHRIVTTGPKMIIIFGATQTSPKQKVKQRIPLFDILLE